MEEGTEKSVSGALRAGTTTRECVLLGKMYVVSHLKVQPAYLCIGPSCRAISISTGVGGVGNNTAFTDFGDR